MKKMFNILNALSIVLICLIILMVCIIVPYSVKNNITNLFVFLSISIFLTVIWICITKYYRNTAVNMKVNDGQVYFEYYNKDDFIIETRLCKRITANGFIIKLFFENCTVKCFQRSPFSKKTLVNNSQLREWFNNADIE